MMLLCRERYSLLLQYILIAGGFDVSLLGELCTFLSHSHCRAALKLGRGKTYLIMGSSKEIHKDKHSQS